MSPLEGETVIELGDILKVKTARIKKGDNLLGQNNGHSKVEKMNKKRTHKIKTI
jgi:hypothetical protein